MEGSTSAILIELTIKCSKSRKVKFNVVDVCVIYKREDPKIKGKNVLENFDNLTLNSVSKVGANSEGQRLKTFGLAKYVRFPSRAKICVICLKRVDRKLTMNQIEVVYL